LKSPNYKKQYGAVRVGKKTTIQFKAAGKTEKTNKQIIKKLIKNNEKLNKNSTL
jgi:hypothetical protein